MIVAGGYLLVHRADTPEIDGFLTVSDCLTCAFPSWWAFTGVEVDLAERRALLSHWGIDPARSPAVVDAAESALEAGDLGWPSVFVSPRAARTFARRCRVTHPALTLVGLGLDRGDLAAFLDGAEAGESGYLDIAAAPTPLAEGTQAGWEVLGYEGGGFHSHHCHPELLADVGVDLDADGLLGSREDAVQVARRYSDEASGAEPVTWLPWMLRTYILKSPRGPRASAGRP